MIRTDYTNITGFAAVLLIAVLTIYSLVMAQAILLPLAWSLLIALLILPVVQWFEQKKVPRPVAIIMVLILAIFLLGFIFYLLSVQVVGILEDVPSLTRRLDQWGEYLQKYTETRWGVTHEMFSRQIATSISGMINASLLQIRNALFTIFQAITLITVIPLYVYFMLYYRDLFFDAFLRIEQKYQKQASSLLGEINSIVQQYLSGMLLVTVIIGALFYIVLIILGIRYAFFFAVLLAIFNLVPYIGVIISSLVVFLYALATTSSLFYPLSLLVSLWFIQFLENNFITPFLVGTRVKVNPLAALIAIFAGSSIWGISGMVLFLPMIGVIKAIFDTLEPLKPYGLMLGSAKNNNQEREGDSGNAGEEE